MISLELFLLGKVQLKHGLKKIRKQQQQQKKTVMFTRDLSAVRVTHLQSGVEGGACEF